ncbi:MAG: TetR/AcrR family transcriptional regulator [Candidatus Helarchaeota archaeon]
MKEKIKKLRQEHHERLKFEIIEASILAFNKYGYYNATIKKIAEISGVSEGTIYNHFKNKRELFIKTILYYFDRIRQTIQSVKISNELNINKYLENIFSNYIDIVKILPLLSIIIYEARLDLDLNDLISTQLFQPLIKEFENFIRYLQYANLLDPNKKINARLFSLFIITLLIGLSTLIEMKNQDFKRFARDEISIALSRILLNGLL